MHEPSGSLRYWIAPLEGDADLDGRVDDRRCDFATVLVHRRIDLAAPRVDPCRDSRADVVAGGSDHRQGIERRDANQRLPRRERQPLHGRDPDAQPGKRAGADRNGEQIDIA